MSNTMTRRSIDYTNVLITLIAGFIIGIVLGYILFSPGLAFGQTLDPNYMTTLSITKNATDQTGNYTIINYVNTIENQTEYKGLGE